MNKVNKKSVFIFVSGIILGLIMGFFAYPVLAQESNVQVEVNDQLVPFPDQGPYIERTSGRTYVPIRFIAESLGAVVDWNQDTKTASINKPGTTDVIYLQIGSKKARLNNLEMVNELDAPARLDNKRTMVPLRFISETLGYYVIWDADNRLVRVSDKPFIATKELTAAQKQRLMAYPYPVDQNGKQYEIIRKMVENKEWTRENSRVNKDILEIMKEPIELNQVIKTNQRLITDADLCYNCYDTEGISRIRGIIQTYKEDGSVIEQDIEYGFTFGAPFVKPGDTPIAAHWLPEYDTVSLSKAKRVQ